MKHSKNLRSLIVAFSILFIGGCAIGFTSIADQQLRAASGEIKPIWIVGKSHVINSANGIQIDMNISNLSDKTIKYATFYILPFNAVGDVIVSEIDGKSLAALTLTGPLDPGEYTTTVWENVWYNLTFSCFEISEIDIEYMDSKTLSLSKAEVSKILMHSTNKLISNSCTQ